MKKTDARDGDAPSSRQSGATIAFVNPKGGAGKTTLTVLAAEALAAGGADRVLVIDLDPLAGATAALCDQDARKRATADERGLAAYLDRINEGKRPEPLTAYAVPSAGAGAIDVVCADESLRQVERDLIERCHALRLRGGAVTRKGADGQARRILADAVAKAASAYDVVLIDSPPGGSIFAEAAVDAADLVVTPTALDPAALAHAAAAAQRAQARPRGDMEAAPARVMLAVNRLRAGDGRERDRLQELRRRAAGGELAAAVARATLADDNAFAEALGPNCLRAGLKRFGRRRVDAAAFGAELRAQVSRPSATTGGGLAGWLRRRAA